MDLSGFAVTALLSLSQLLGVSSDARPRLERDWTVTRNWEELRQESGGNQLILEASSARIPELCRAHPESYVRFPAIIHGAHEFYDGKRLLLQYGDPSTKRTRSFYGAPYLSCGLLQHTTALRWVVHSYTWYFARANFAPFLVETPPKDNVLAETLNIIAGGSLLLLTVFSALIFRGKVSHGLLVSLTAANFSMAVYFISSTAGMFGIHLSMLALHRIADFSLWIGISLIFCCLQLQQILSRGYLIFYLAVVSAALALILSGKSGDVIQLGTTLPFGLTLYILVHCFWKFLSRIRSGHRKMGTIGQAFGLALFALTGINDMLSIVGLTSQPMLLPLGVVGALLFIAIAVNDQIIATYQERDYLRLNLQKEVERKTTQLRTQTEALEKSMAELKSTQAELLHSAKLASLGTLAAGIAHEINNSINFVKGALPPLEKIGKTLPEDSAREKFRKLIEVMKNGIELTVEIIHGLKMHTGLNEAKLRDVKISSLIQSVLSILKHRIQRGVDIRLDIPSEHQVFGNIVGLNQVFTNLITNALDAMESSGSASLLIRSQDWDDSIAISVQDSGPGISEQLQKRIFEPFFTTKDVGKGTGLGLYIVHNEVKKHGGRIELRSVPGQGTTFTIVLPKEQPKLAGAQPAPETTGAAA